jgi:hypothetical protein
MIGKDPPTPEAKVFDMRRPTFHYVTPLSDVGSGYCVLKRTVPRGSTHGSTRWPSEAMREGPAGWRGPGNFRLHSNSGRLSRSGRWHCPGSGGWLRSIPATSCVPIPRRTGRRSSGCDWWACCRPTICVTRGPAGVERSDGRHIEPPAMGGTKPDTEGDQPPKPAPSSDDGGSDKIALLGHRRDRHAAAHCAMGS